MPFPESISCVGLSPEEQVPLHPHPWWSTLTPREHLVAAEGFLMEVAAPGLAQVQRGSLSVSTAREGATPGCPRPYTAAGRRHGCGQFCSSPGQARTPLSLPPEAQCASQAHFLTTRRWRVLPG